MVLKCVECLKPFQEGEQCLYCDYCQNLIHERFAFAVGVAYNYLVMKSKQQQQQHIKVKG